MGLPTPTIKCYNLLILGTGRGYGQHNTVVYNPADKYRGMPHRHCILMNLEDIKNAGFQPINW
ncbi:hypothetical protein [Planktothrix agardhii]|uniref:hypothetical protein n=1 Tax=Planktothrix agardhii TaxID=1160 RepID=UPI0020A7E4E4|nr:hypothetical protein [Planktothrix agardhii]MCP9295904.1 hypothetical protein [Planktothrix agardhii LY1]MEA5561945.1 hypothetical protein [Planktothrix agardhii UHCC 0887]